MLLLEGLLSAAKHGELLRQAFESTSTILAQVMCQLEPSRRSVAEFYCRCDGRVLQSENVGPDAQMSSDTRATHSDTLPDKRPG